MQASQLTFGVELETYIPENVPFGIGSYRDPLRISVPDDPRYDALRNWKAGSDSSIAPSVGCSGCEFISPVMQGTEGLQQLHKAVSALENVVGARVNTSCGVHVHIGFPRDKMALKRLTHLVAQSEKALYAASGSPRRETGRFCKGIQADYSSRIRFTNSTRLMSGLSCNISQAANDRYRILNLSPLLSGRETVEFRVFSGTVKADKVIAWVRLCLAICEKAINSTKAFKWEKNDKAVVYKERYNPNATYKTGDGFANAKLLMYSLGWVSGRSFVRVDGKRVNKVWGQSVAEVDGLPTLDESKATIYALARKYDEKIAANEI